MHHAKPEQTKYPQTHLHLRLHLQTIRTYGTYGLAEPGKERNRRTRQEPAAANVEFNHAPSHQAPALVAHPEATALSAGSWVLPGLSFRLCVPPRSQCSVAQAKGYPE